MKLEQPRYTLINPSRHLWWAHIVDSLLQKLSLLGIFKHVIYLLHFIESPHSVFMTVGLNRIKVCLKIKTIPHTSASSYLLPQKAGARVSVLIQEALAFLKAREDSLLQKRLSEALLTGSVFCSTRFPRVCPPESLVVVFFSHGAPGPSLWVFCSLGSYYCEIHDSSLLESLRHWLQGLPWSPIMQVTLFASRPNFLSCVLY